MSYSESLLLTLGYYEEHANNRTIEDLMGWIIENIIHLLYLAVGGFVYGTIIMILGLLVFG